MNYWLPKGSRWALILKNIAGNLTMTLNKHLIYQGHSDGGEVQVGEPIEITRMLKDGDNTLNLRLISQTIGTPGTPNIWDCEIGIAEFVEDKYEQRFLINRDGQDNTPSQHLVVDATVVLEYSRP